MKTNKGLVICHDYWHCGDIVTQGLQFLQDHSWELTILREMEHADLKVVDFSEYRAIFVCKDNRNSYEDAGQWLDDLLAMRFTRYVEAGGCLMILHAGATAPTAVPLFKDLVGCVFVMHPDQCSVEYFPVGNSVITDGVLTFVEHDEHYKIAISADDINVFLSSKSEYFEEVAGYYRHVGRGKVVVLTPGHNLPVWLNPEYQKLILGSLAFSGC